MKLTKLELKEYIKLKDKVRNASAQMHITKNERTECAFDEAIEALGVFEDTHGIKIGTSIVELIPKTNFASITATPEALAEFIAADRRQCHQANCSSECDGCTKEGVLRWLEKESDAE